MNVVECLLCVLQMFDACPDPPPTFGGHIDHGKEASQLHSLLVDLLEKVDSKVTFWALYCALCGLGSCGPVTHIGTTQELWFYL